MSGFLYTIKHMVAETGLFNWMHSEQEGSPKRVILTLKIKGVEVGTAELETYTEPFRFYYLDDLTVKEEERGKGYGRRMLKKVNRFLRDKRAVGFLHDGIDPLSLAYGLYAKNGWKEVSGENGILAYGLTSKHTKEKIEEAINSF